MSERIPTLYIPVATERDGVTAHAGSPASAPSHPGNKTVVFFNDAKHEFDSPNATGADLYAKFGVPAGNKLFLDVKKHNDPDRLIPNDSTPQSLKNGDHYYDLPPGTVG